MKKILFAAFAAAALAIGCSQDEVLNESPSLNQAIEFSTYNGKAPISRAGVLDNTNLLNFGIYASYTADGAWSDAGTMNFMFNQKVERENVSSPWSYTPLKYWPAKQGEKISFFAYAPYFDNQTTPAATITEESNETDTGAPKVKFSISKNVEEMVDFTAGIVMDKSKVDNFETTPGNTVVFELKHELTRVNFSAKLDRDAFGTDAANKTKINITAVKFDGGKDNKLCNEAIYTFPTDPTKLGTWSGHQYNDGEIVVTSILNAKPATGELGNYKENGVLVPTTESVPLFKDAQYLFLIPAEASTGLTATDVVNVTFTYDIVTADAELNGGFVKSTATKTVQLPVNSLIQGKAYNYTFTFGLHEIKVDATVADWNTDNNGGNTIVDWTDTDATF